MQHVQLWNVEIQYIWYKTPQITARIQEIPCDFDKYSCRIVFILTPWYLSFYVGNEIQTRNQLKHGPFVLILEKHIISRFLPCQP